MKHPSEEQLIALRLGDAAPAEAVEIQQHVGTCRECQADLDAIDLTLAAATASLPVPERSEAYGAEVWARLQPRIERERRGWWLDVRDWFSPKRLAFAGGLALVIIAAFVAGRFSLRPAPPEAVAVHPQAPAAGTPTSGSEKLRQQILLVAMGDHLERSQMALVELVNASGNSHVDIAPEQERARDLVVENRLYRQTAVETGNPAMASVLDDLERVLVEVANSPSELTKADFERVRGRIESQGIIFKVRVLGEQVRDLEARPAADGRVQG